MALGKRQRETLDMYASMCKRSPDVIRLQITIGRKRSYTREFGVGMAITITPYECYEEGEYDMQGSWIADCQYEYTAVDKSKEIARYLVGTGCPKDRIRINKR